jgi:hypothetical protein
MECSCRGEKVMPMGMFWFWMGCSFAVGTVFGGSVLLYLAAQGGPRF